MVQSMAEERPRGGILQASIRLGRVWGIPLGLHYSWFIIAALITFSLAGHFTASQPEWGAGLTWGIAALTAVLFFVTLLAHEMSHAVMARARGIPVRSITLFALGGIAQMERDADSARTEFWVAIVGPITSIVIGVGAIAAAGALGWSVEAAGGGGVLGAVLGWLGSINILLAVFNMLPGYPLDGGRVLRAILWGFYGDGNRATRAAARTGQVVAGLFILFGLVQFFFGAGLGGLWLAFIGWFLLSAAQASYSQVALTEALRDVRVADLMSSDCVAVEPATTLQSLVDDLLLRTGRRCIMVSRGGEVQGLVTPNEVRGVERERWPEVTVREIMRPLDRLRTVSPETSATEALVTMAREDLNQLPVMRRGHLEGFVTRGHILQVIEARSELNA
jgi:Zn-dependent protease/predicted transcriptional regulator